MPSTWECNFCKCNTFTSRELILVDVLTQELKRKSWIVCTECYKRLEDMEILAIDEFDSFEENQIVNEYAEKWGVDI